MQNMLRPTDNLTKEGSIRDLVLWLANLVSAPVVKPASILVKKWEKSETEGNYIKFEFFTERHKYVISAQEKEASTYMCVALVTRAPLPGERHLRFRNIGDGKICFVTWLFALEKLSGLKWQVLILIIQPYLLSLDKIRG